MLDDRVQVFIGSTAGLLGPAGPADVSQSRLWIALVLFAVMVLFFATFRPYDRDELNSAQAVANGACVLHPPIHKDKAQQFAKV